MRSDNCARLYPGFDLGSETEWSQQQGSLANSFSVPILQNLVYDNLSYNVSTFNWASDVADLDARAGALINGISTDLGAFSTHGGKLIVTQGWADPYNAATWPIEHLEEVQMSSRDDVAEWFRVFMIPGGGHCTGAASYPGVPQVYHSVASLVQWIEGGRAPSEMLSSKPADGSERTRKLCPWPATARWVSGNVDDWNSYVCE